MHALANLVQGSSEAGHLATQVLMVGDLLFDLCQQKSARLAHLAHLALLGHELGRYRITRPAAHPPVGMDHRAVERHQRAAAGEGRKRERRCGILHEHSIPNQSRDERLVFRRIREPIDERAENARTDE